MSQSVYAVDTHTEAYGRIGTSQAPLAGMLAKVRGMHTLGADVIARATFSGCLVAAAQFCGKEDQDLAPEIHISQSYMSRFMRGVGEQWAKRVIAFMRVTGSIAPLQWLAEQVGCDIVQRDPQAEHIARLERELLAARRGRAA